jgi:hypothetical protein
VAASLAAAGTPMATGSVLAASGALSQLAHSSKQPAHLAVLLKTAAVRPVQKSLEVVGHEFDSLFGRPDCGGPASARASCPPGLGLEALTKPAPAAVQQNSLVSFRDI